MHKITLPPTLFSDCSQTTKYTVELSFPHIFTVFPTGRNGFLKISKCFLHLMFFQEITMIPAIGYFSCIFPIFPLEFSPFPHAFSNRRGKLSIFMELRRKINFIVFWSFGQIRFSFRRLIRFFSTTNSMKRKEFAKINRKQFIGVSFSDWHFHYFK
jgi:hypothetical protein